MEFPGTHFNPDISSIVAVQAIGGMGSHSTAIITGTAFGVGAQASNVVNPTGQPASQQPSLTSKAETIRRQKPKNWFIRVKHKVQNKITGIAQACIPKEYRLKLSRSKRKALRLLKDNDIPYLLADRKRHFIPKLYFDVKSDDKESTPELQSQDIEMNLSSDSSKIIGGTQSELSSKESNESWFLAEPELKESMQSKDESKEPNMSQPIEQNSTEDIVSEQLPFEELTIDSKLLAERKSQEITSVIKKEPSQYWHPVLMDFQQSIKHKSNESNESKEILTCCQEKQSTVRPIVKVQVIDCLYDESPAVLAVISNRFLKDFPKISNSSDVLGKEIQDSEFIDSDSGESTLVPDQYSIGYESAINMILESILSKVIESHNTNRKDLSQEETESHPIDCFDTHLKSCSENRKDCPPESQESKDSQIETQSKVKQLVRTSDSGEEPFTESEENKIGVNSNEKKDTNESLAIGPSVEPKDPVVVSSNQTEDLLRNQEMTPFPSQPLQHSLEVNPNVMNRRPVGRDSRDSLVLYMKQLPYSKCTDRDVLKFFEPIRLNDIVIECDPKGEPTGNAFVEFENSRDYDSGLQRNRKQMGRHYIKLKPTSKENMIDARRVYQPQPPVMNHNLPTFCVHITGFPVDVTERYVTNYFSRLGTQPYAIHGLNAGEVYIEFGTPESQSIAIGCNGDKISYSRLSIKPVSFEMMREIVGKLPPIIEQPIRPITPPRSSRRGRHDDRMKPQHRREQRRVRDDSDDSDDPFGDSRCCVIASNIPYRASTEDICVFFSYFGITQDCVQRRFNYKGQPAGEAQIAFHTPEDATRAVREMHKKFLMGRSVYLIESDRVFGQSSQ